MAVVEETVEGLNLSAGGETDRAMWTFDPEVELATGFVWKCFSFLSRVFLQSHELLTEQLFLTLGETSPVC